MKQIRLAILTAALAVLLCAPCRAADGDFALQDYEPGSLAEEYAFETQSLDEIMAQFLATYGLSEQNFSMAYRATGSGEAYLFAENVFRPAASTYKLPLNMYYYDMERAGEISSDAMIGGWSLPTLHYGTIVNSDNDMAISMLYNLGTFRQYRELLARYCDQEYDYIYYVDNYINAGYMLAVLERLYDNAADYEELIGYMKIATPDAYFKRYVSDFEIAHKYGYFEESINDVGIIFTPEPYLLAAYTEGAQNGEMILGRLCELLTEYTVWQTAQARALEAEAEAAAVAAAEPEPEPEPAIPAGSALQESHPITVIEHGDDEPATADIESPAHAPEETRSPEVTPADAAPQTSRAVWIAAAAAVAVLMLVALLRARRRRPVHK